MTWKDKLEIGLKEDAPYRKDNLPESQVRGPEIPSGPGRSPEIPAAREDAKKVKKVPETVPDDLPPQDDDAK
jgi:hypothetical protein